jgi:hypothetical protein
VFEYPVELEEMEEDGEPWIMVTAPDLPGFRTCGDDRPSALDHARGCLVAWAWGRMEEERDMPPASPAQGRPSVRLPIGATLKVLIHQAMRSDRVSQAELARRMNQNLAEVAHILDFGHATPPDQLEAALEALGRTPVIEIARLETAA